jgi:hypothetical protein
VSRRPIETRNPLIGAKEIDEPYGLVGKRRPDVLIVPESTAREFIPRPPRAGMAEAAVGERFQSDTDAQAFFRAVLSDSLDHYELVFIAAPKLPRWTKALGARTVQVHASVGNRQWILRRLNP